MKAFFGLLMILSVSFYAQASQIFGYYDPKCPFNQPRDWTVVKVMLSDWEEAYISTLPCPYGVMAITHIDGHPIWPEERFKICEHKECVCPPEGMCCPVVEIVRVYFMNGTEDDIKIPVECKCTC